MKGDVGDETAGLPQLIKTVRSGAIRLQGKNVDLPGDEIDGSPPDGGDAVAGIDEVAIAVGIEAGCGFLGKRTKGVLIELAIGVG